MTKSLYVYMIQGQTMHADKKACNTFDWLISLVILHREGRQFSTRGRHHKQ
jgi:hypothetical protein